MSCSRRRRRRNEHAGIEHRPSPRSPSRSSGVAAGNTALCSVGRSGNDLHYRGYDILEVAETCEFEEIAYLLIHGKLPNTHELAAYKTKLKSLRGDPGAGARHPRAASTSHAPHGRHAHGRFRARLRAARSQRPQRLGRARDRRPPGGELRVDALLLVSLLAQQPPHPRGNRRRLRGRSLPASAAPSPARPELGARHAHLAQPLRRT